MWINLTRRYMYKLVIFLNEAYGNVLFLNSMRLFSRNNLVDNKFLKGPSLEQDIG